MGASSGHGGGFVPSRSPNWLTIRHEIPIIARVVTEAAPQTVPNYVDLRRASRRAQHYADSMDAKRLPRLAEAGVGLVEPLQVSLTVRAPEYRPATVTGSIRGVLQVACQRCLEPMSFPIDLAVDWEVVSPESDEPLGDAEPLLAEDDRLQLIDAVTDECLLAVPDYPRHEACEAPQIKTDEPQ